MDTVLVTMAYGYSYASASYYGSYYNENDDESAVRNVLAEYTVSWNSHDLRPEIRLTPSSLCRNRRSPNPLGARSATAEARVWDAAVVKESTSVPRWMWALRLPLPSAWAKATHKDSPGR